MEDLDLDFSSPTGTVVDEQVDGTGASASDFEQPLDINEIIVKNAQEKALEEVEGVDDKKITPSPDDVNKSSKDMPFSLIHASLLKERGIISDYDEGAFKKLIDEKGADGEIEVLESIIAKTIEDARAELTSQYEADVKDYIEMLDAGVDSETAKSLVGNKAKLDSITEDVLEADDSIELRKNIMFNHYKNTSKFSDQKIEKLIQQTIVAGSDIDEAKEALSALKEDAESRIKQERLNVEKAKADYIKQEEAKIKSYKDAIQSKDSLIEGTQLTKAEKMELEAMILKPVKTEDGRTINAVWAEREKDPINFDIWLAFAVKNGLHKGSIPEPAKKNIKSSVANNLKDILASKRGGRGLTPDSSEQLDFSPEKKDTDKALGI